ncbi:hypothetical protein BKA66DRAFT_613376 [Pyrenochaeta sp. MPI-SDFR-AT-0127]|nr:hypothetical protein BKA66DRAFT_613376 [Pyrenochaeta sp. MPI-SDFR-AT-0127]
MTERVDTVWAQAELIPFLNLVFGNRLVTEWEMDIGRAELNIGHVRFYEDFPSTVECLRLSLVNPAVLTAAETVQFACVRPQVQLCVEILVRHAIRQHTYPLFSLGYAPSCDFPRVEADTTQTKAAGTLTGARQAVQPQLLSRDAEAWAVGFSLAKQKGKDNRQGKPRSRGSVGLGELGFSQYRQQNVNVATGLHGTPVHSLLGTGPTALANPCHGLSGKFELLPDAGNKGLRGVAQEFRPGAGSHGL